MQRRVNLADSFGVCADKLSFLLDAFSQNLAPGSTFDLTDAGQNGLAIILREVRDELDASTDVMVERLTRKEA